MTASSCTECGRLLPAGVTVCPACTPTIGTLETLLTGVPQIEGYRMLRRLGAGGMGSVYLAHDETLNRAVAVKVISERLATEPAAQSRFMREARAMAAVEHPHVVRVYGYGEVDDRAYLVMEHVAGGSLADRIRRDGPLPLPDALDILRQVIDGLEAAWDRQLVHRDVKPANVLLDGKGHARVADFGLAKPLEVQADSPSLSMTGLVIGTPQYMSPEQAHGQSVDFRTDVYSLGIVLFEMLTASPPFSGSSPFSILDQHVHAPLPAVRDQRPDVPPEVDSLIRWMTHKDPAQRPPGYAALREAVKALSDAIVLPGSPSRRTPFPWRSPKLAWTIGSALVLSLLAAGGYLWTRQPATPAPPTAAANAARPPAVVVLPFRNIGNDTTRDYFGVALADLLTTRLAPSRDVVVRPLSGVLALQKNDPQQVAQAMNADYVVDGSWLYADKQWRISVSLYDAKTNAIAWSDQISAADTEVFALQDRVGLPLAAALNARVGGDDGLRATDMTTRSADAYYAYLQGRERLQTGSSVDPSDAPLLAAAERFEQAVALDPRFAAPKHSLAMAKLLRADFGFDTRASEIEAATALALDAIRLDDRQAEAFATLSLAYMKRGLLEPQFEALRRAVTLEPNNDVIRLLLGVFYQAVGLWDALREQCDLIRRLNPSNMYPVSQLALLDLWRGEYLPARTQLHSYLRGAPDNSMMEAYVAVAEAGLGNTDEVNRIVERLIKRDNPVEIWLALALAMTGQGERATALLVPRALAFAESDNTVAYWLATVYARLGRREDAIAWARKAVERGWVPYPAYANDPNFASVREDGRFQAMLVDLEVRWRAAEKAYRLP